jgi:hypothetical protein
VHVKSSRGEMILSCRGRWSSYNVHWPSTICASTKTHTHEIKMHPANISPRRSRCASSSVVPVPPLSVPAPPWPLPRPASQACGTARRYIALANETHLNVPARSWPLFIIGYHTEKRKRETEHTSMTSSNTTNAVPFVFGSFPMRICLMLP